MENALDRLASRVNGSVVFHEALPEDFGPAGERWPLFAACMQTLLSRHPGLLVDLIGSEEALAKLGLRPGTTQRVGAHHLCIYRGLTERPGAVRLLLRSRTSPAVAAQHSGGIEQRA